MASFPAESRHPSILKFTIFNLTFSILFPGFSVAAINSNRIKQQSHQPSSPSPARTACCSPRREPWVTRQRKNKSPEGATGKALSPFPPLPPVQYFPPLPITSRFFPSQQETFFPNNLLATAIRIANNPFSLLRWTSAECHPSNRRCNRKQPSLSLRFAIVNLIFSVLPRAYLRGRLPPQIGNQLIHV